MAKSKRLKSSRSAPRRSSSNQVRSLRFYLYTVNGRLHNERRTLHVVCCHASDARAMVATHEPRIDKLRVTRGSLVHFIAVGDHALREAGAREERAVGTLRRRAAQTLNNPISLVPPTPVRPSPPHGKRAIDF